MDQSNYNRNENLKLIKRWVDAANAHDPVLIGETLGDDYEYVFGVSTIKGRQEDMEDWKIFFEAFPDMNLEVQQTIADEDSVAVRIRMTGTQKGTFKFVTAQNITELISASSKKIDIPMCSFYRIEDGKIIQLHRYFDTAKLLNQLGVS
ncbi:MAG: nuclear transport factor 2 family protein [Ignavibacteria bacterium]